MQESRASVTAGIVATFRTLGDLLPPAEQIAHDPYGARLAGKWAERAVVAARGLPMMRPLRRYVLYMQVRTRAIDDVLLGFVQSGGRQIVLLGAGYDARALRFADRLGDATVFEVDHPATQARKREALAGVAGSVRVEYSSFDFETQPASALPDALAAHGHRRAQRTLTIWEGVTMYLTEEAIDTTLSAVRAYSGAGSRIAFTYFEKERMLSHRGLGHRLVRRFVASVGEPFRFGWDRDELSPWLKRRGFELVSDRTEADLANSLLPRHAAEQVEELGRHVAVAAC